MLSAAKASASADETAVFVTAILGSASETIGTLRVPDTYLLHQRHRPSPVGEATAQTSGSTAPPRLAVRPIQGRNVRLADRRAKCVDYMGSSASSWSPEGEFPISGLQRHRRLPAALSEQGLHTLDRTWPAGAEPCDQRLHYSTMEAERKFDDARAAPIRSKLSGRCIG